MLQNLWGRPPGLRGTPSSRSPPVESRPCTRRWPTRASAADEGVRPTIYADVRLWENYVALGAFACQPVVPRRVGRRKRRKRLPHKYDIIVSLDYFAWNFDLYGSDGGGLGMCLEYGGGRERDSGA